MIEPNDLHDCVSKVYKFKCDSFLFDTKSDAMMKEMLISFLHVDVILMARYSYTTLGCVMTDYFFKRCVVSFRISRIEEPLLYVFIKAYSG